MIHTLTKSDHAYGAIPSSQHIRTICRPASTFAQYADRSSSRSEPRLFEKHMFTAGGSDVTYQWTSNAVNNILTTYLNYTVENNTVNTWLNDLELFSISTINNGIQTWTVPQTGSYTITAKGAAGSAGHPQNSGNTLGGNGAIMEGTFDLEKGEKIEILCGQIGMYGNRGGGGGGGTFVVKSGATTANYSTHILVIAGGGGGGGYGSNHDGVDASTGESGTFASDGTGGPGENGNGGDDTILDDDTGSPGSWSGAPGAGFLTDATLFTDNFASYEWGQTKAHAFLRTTDRGKGGVGSGTHGDGGYGGFGGGGSPSMEGGGGGGDSGGAIGISVFAYAGGGGGGSKNTSTDQNNSTDGNTGAGEVEIIFNSN